MKINTRPKTTLSTLLVLALLPLAARAESCLWKASSDRGTFYLQGSFHLLKKSDYPLASAIEDAYAASDVLIFETDIGQMISPESQQLVMKKAMLPAGRTLEQELDPKVYAQLAEKLNESGLPPAALKQFKPWYATTTLMILRMRALGMDPQFGLDQYFHRKAVADHKKEVGLETIEFQASLFDALSEGNQNRFTKHALEEIGQIESKLAEMRTAWKKGDADKLDSMMKESFEDYPEMYKTFVTDRNNTWADKLDGMASRKKTAMVVVGAAHLTGENGLLNLLKAKGYTVEQL